AHDSVLVETVGAVKRLGPQDRCVALDNLVDGPVVRNRYREGTAKHRLEDLTQSRTLALDGGNRIRRWNIIHHGNTLPLAEPFEASEEKQLVLFYRTT